MSLLERQFAFSKLVGLFLLELNQKGYTVSLDECYRPPEVAALYEKEHKGVCPSLHSERLAIDLNFFRNGKLLTSFEDLLPIGQIWESYQTGEIFTKWGGRFKSLDLRHFSIQYQGLQ